MKHGDVPISVPLCHGGKPDGEEDARNRVGHGTLGQLIALRGCQYYGLDIADGPVEMMRYRLALAFVSSPSYRQGMCGRS